MYDYNFFENYKYNKKSTVNTKGLAPLTFILAMFVLGGVTAYSFYQNGLLLGQNILMTTELALPENVDTFSRIESKQTLKTTLTTISQDLNGAVTMIDQKEVITQDLMDLIVLSLPSDAQILNMSISDNTISINGVAAQRSAVAEFEKNLRDTGVFASVTLSTINTQEEEYNYDLSISLGGVVNENIN